MAAEEGPIASEAALQAELESLLRRAYEGDVAVEGGWACRNGADHPDWDVVVTEVEKPDRSA